MTALPTALSPAFGTIENGALSLCKGGFHAIVCHLDSSVSMLNNSCKVAAVYNFLLG